MSIVAIDFETVELTDAGPVASTEAYRKEFRVDSMALAFSDGRSSEFIQGEDACRARLGQFPAGTPFIAHNVQFEMLVAKCRFPSITFNWHADTMRLAQLYDNGGGDDAFEFLVDPDEILDDGDMPTVKRKPISGLGLVVCTKRILGAKGSHKEEAYTWINANVPKSKGKEGRFLNLLPPDIMARYNIADADFTLQLYSMITARFRNEGFDWTFDWQLFISTVRHIVDSKIRGVDVTRDVLQENAATVRAEIVAIEKEFADRFAEPIKAVEADRLAAWLAKVKTEKGRAKRRAKYEAGDTVARDAVDFNSGSNAQLAQLFVGKLGISPQFFTAKGAPSFKSSMLSQWGDGGELLKTRRKRMLVLSQMESLEELSAHDGKFHIDLKVCGTSTGRMAGGRH